MGIHFLLLVDTILLSQPFHNIFDIKKQHFLTIRVRRDPCFCLIQPFFRSFHPFFGIKKRCKVSLTRQKSTFSCPRTHFLNDFARISNDSLFRCNKGKVSSLSKIIQVCLRGLHYLCNVDCGQKHKVEEHRRNPSTTFRRPTDRLLIY